MSHKGKDLGLVQHLFLHAGCPSCQPINSVKTLKSSIKAVKPTKWINNTFSVL